jgi:hypothetical protein
MSSQLESWQRLKEKILENVQDGENKTQLDFLLNHIISYLKRVFLGIAMEYAIKVPEHPILKIRNQPLSYELGRELDYRLHLIASYKIVDGNRISQLLTAGLLPPSTLILSHRQTEYLSAQHMNLEIGKVALANKLGISPRTMKREQQQLFSQYGIRTASTIDPQRFGLTHLGIQFRAKTIEMAEAFDTWIRTKALRENQLPFLLGCEWDVNHQDGFLSFYLPNQNPWKQQYHSLFERLEEHFFEIVTKHQIQGCFSNLNFDYYDHVSRQWRILSDVQTEGLARFIEIHGEQFAPRPGFDYSSETISFNHVDWLLALTLSDGLLIKKERTQLLSSYGFPLAEKTLWTHERQLRKTNALFSSLAFSHLTFEDIIFITAQCEESSIPTMHQLISQYAMSRLYPTDKGVMAFIGVPVGGASLMKQLTLTLLNISALEEVSVLRFKRDIPQVPSISTFTFWNATTKRWAEPSEEWSN